MNLRYIVSAFVIAIAALGYVAWQRTTEKAQPAQPPAQTGGSEMPPMQAPAEDPGVAWKAPDRWLAQLGSGMRLATYVVPGSTGGADAECAVYYFGPGQGGGVDANIARWIGEFSTDAEPERRSEEIAGMRVARVKVSGAYLSHGGAPDADPDAQAGWSLLGAIVGGPNGSLFFKLTGPSSTVGRAEGEFDGMLRSLARQ